jgi:hypothetical protein
MKTKVCNVFSFSNKGGGTIQSYAIKVVGKVKAKGEELRE